MDPSRKPPSAAPPDQEDALVSGLIHEMRHPLLGIKSGLQLLARQGGDALTSLDEWQMVAAQVERMEELFKTYAGLFRRTGAAGASFDVEQVVRRAVELLRYRLGGLGTRFTYLPGPAGAVGHGAPQAVFHAVTNLIGNALDAVEATGEPGRIEVRVVSPPPGFPFVEVRVSDEGIGIARENRERIFDLRFTTKPADKGTGLGLHIARVALMACGGDLRVVPEDDAGRAPWAHTEFALQVPTPEDLR